MGTDEAQGATVPPCRPYEMQQREHRGGGAEGRGVGEEDEGVSREVVMDNEELIMPEWDEEKYGPQGVSLYGDHDYGCRCERCVEVDRQAYAEAGLDEHGMELQDSTSESVVAHRVR